MYALNFDLCFLQLTPITPEVLSDGFFTFFWFSEKLTALKFDHLLSDGFPLMWSTLSGGKEPVIYRNASLCALYLLYPIHIIKYPNVLYPDGLSTIAFGVVLERRKKSPVSGLYENRFFNSDCVKFSISNYITSIGAISMKIMALDALAERYPHDSHVYEIIKQRGYKGLQ